MKYEAKSSLLFAPLRLTELGCWVLGDVPNNDEI